MNDLLNTLYDYVLTQSESYLAVYPVWLRHQAEQEAAFQASLALCRELNRAALA